MAVLHRSTPARKNSAPAVNRQNCKKPCTNPVGKPKITERSQITAKIVTLISAARGGDEAQMAAQLHSRRENLFPPDAAKTMRTFTSGEAAALLGVGDSYLRKLHLDGPAWLSRAGDQP